MKDKLIREILPNLNTLDKNKHYLVAYSGGADSTVLLHSLKSLGFNISAVHVHHNCRKESDDELLFCKETAEGLSIPFYSTKLEFEEHEQKNQNTYRVKRYQFIKEIYNLTNASGVFLGQHLDDQVENAITAFFRRKNVTALKSMSFKSEYLGMNLYRPLLVLRKQEILNMTSRNSLKYVTDSSNFEEVYQRNTVRLSLVPIAEKIFGKGIYKTLEQMVNNAQEQEESNAFYANKLIDKYWTGKYMKLEALEEHTITILVHALTLLLKEKGYSVDSSSFNDLRNLLQQKKQGYVALKGCTLSVLKDRLIIKDGTVDTMLFTKGRKNK